MFGKSNREQFSLAGMLFAMAGFCIGFAVLPYLDAHSPMSPSASVIFVIVLIFAWCMIPLRRGADKAWWIGFVVFGIVYLGAWQLIAARVAAASGQIATTFSKNHPAIFAWVSLRLGSVELIGVLTLITLALLALIAFGIIGGIMVRRLFVRRGDKCSAD